MPHDPDATDAWICDDCSEYYEDQSSCPHCGSSERRATTPA